MLNAMIDLCTVCFRSIDEVDCSKIWRDFRWADVYVLEDGVNFPYDKEEED